MPRIMETVVYQFAELSDAAKEKAREWWRECEMREFQAEFEFAETAAKLLGVEFSNAARARSDKAQKPVYRPDIRYSGFCSQGDGASFVGTYTFVFGCSDAVRKEFPEDTSLHAIADGLSALYAARKLRGLSTISASVTQSGNYYHARTMGLENVVAGDNEDEDISAEEEDTLLDLMRDFADWIYDGLESDYNYRLEDEQVDGNIEANEYEFDEDGDCV